MISLVSAVVKIGELVLQVLDLLSRTLLLVILILLDFLDLTLKEVDTRLEFAVFSSQRVLQFFECLSLLLILLFPELLLA